MTAIALLLAVLCIASAPAALLSFGVVAFAAPVDLKKVLPFYIFAVAVLAYSLEPNYENDLVHYFEQIAACRYIPITEALTWADDGLIVKNAVFWAIGQIGDAHLLPAIAMGIFYGITAYIVIDSASDARAASLVLLLQILMLPAMEAASNVRNISAFALIMLAAYRDMVQGKRNAGTLFLYILPCFVHMTGFFLVLCRIVVPLFRRRPVVAVALVVGIPSATIALYAPLRTIVSAVPGNIGLILNRALLKAYTVTMSTSNYALTMRDSGYVTACEVVMFIAAIALVTLAIRHIRSHSGPLADFSSFALMPTSLTAVWAVLRIVKYWVFGCASVIACGPMLAHYMSRLNSKGKIDRACIAIVWFSAVVRFLLELYYMSSRIDLAGFIYNVFTTNAFTIVVGILSALC